MLNIKLVLESLLVATVMFVFLGAIGAIGTGLVIGAYSLAGVVGVVGLMSLLMIFALAAMYYDDNS